MSLLAGCVRATLRLTAIGAIAGRLVRLLEGAVADPECAIGRLDILGADERHTILREWNATARAVPGATLPELFAVARTPEADAVVSNHPEILESVYRDACHVRPRACGIDDPILGSKLINFSVPTIRF